MSDRFFPTTLLTLAVVAGVILPTTPLRAATEPDSVKYWIMFADKGPEETLRSAATEDAHILDRALERRRLRGDDRYNNASAPVFKSYIDELNQLDIQEQVTSRWLNAVSAYLTGEMVPKVRALPFVRHVQPVGSAIVEEVGEIINLTAQSPVPPVLAGDASAVYGPSETQLSLANAISPLEQGFNGSGVRLGFLDTTFDNFNHPAFDALRNDGRLIEVRNFTGLSQTNLHGRAVASIAAGFQDGQLVGPGHGAEILAATTEYAPTETNQEEDNFVAGLEWLESMGADVVNVSLGYTTFDAGESSYTTGDLNGDTGITTVAADIAASHGIVMVVSAGNWVDYLSAFGRYCNSPAECWYYVGTPADGDSVIAVGAVDATGTRAPFSSFGPTADGRTKPDVSAMGAGVYYASSAATGFSFGNGTSFSAPMVAGIATQMLQANPTLKPAQVLDILRQSGSQSMNPDNVLGWGIVDAAVAVSSAIAVGIEDETPRADFHLAAYPNPFDEHVTFTIESAVPGPASITVYDVLGREVARPVQSDLPAGRHAIVWSGNDLAAGVYVYVATTSLGSRTGQLVRL